MKKRIERELEKEEKPQEGLEYSFREKLMKKRIERKE